MQTTKLQFQKGSSIIEMMVAFAILALAITAVITVSFGNQSTAVSSELNNKAVYLAEGVMEDAYANSVADWNSLVPGTINEVEGIFTKKLTVWPGLCSRRADVTISWETPPAPAQQISLSNVFTDIETSLALSNDCPSGETDDWENPGDAISEALSGFPATDIDVVDNMIYLTTEPSSATNPDFFIYEFNPSTETLTKRSELNTGEGLYAVDVAGDYAFVINKTKTPPPQPKNVWQLQIIEISDPNTPVPVQSANLPDVGDGTYPTGISIYHYGDVVYVGTEESSDDPEFYIFDVSNPETIPLPPLESVEVGYDVRAITVVETAGEKHAYLATSDTDKELTVVELSGPSVNSDLGFDAPGDHWGSAVTAAGRIYFGLRREDADDDSDFFILDKNKILDDAEDDDGIVGSVDIGLANNARITGIVVRASGQKALAFLGLDDSTAGLEIWNISNEGDLELNSGCGEPNFSENGAGIDMNDDYIFTANSANAKIRVFKDQNTACSIPLP